MTILQLFKHLQLVNDFKNIFNKVAYTPTQQNGGV